MDSERIQNARRQEFERWQRTRLDSELMRKAGQLSLDDIMPKISELTHLPGNPFYHEEPPEAA